MTVAGADVWKGKWVVVVLGEGQFESAFLSGSMEEALARVPEAEVVGVDIPIGLPGPGQTRAADLEARRYIGRRWQSVFLAPPLDILQASSQAEANVLARSRGWPGIAAQTFALKASIMQVQPLAATDKRLYEVHPEVSFTEANGGIPLPWPKTSWNGTGLRRAVLERLGIVVPADLGLAGLAGTADVFDAAIVAWSAGRVASGRAVRLPEGTVRGHAIWR